MAWEVAIQLSIFGTSFLLAYIAFNLESDENTENQLLRFLLIGFAMIFAFVGVGANFGILDATGIGVGIGTKISHSLNAIYIPFVILLILMVIYSFYFVIKRIVQHVQEIAEMKKEGDQGNR